MQLTEDDIIDRIWGLWNRRILWWNQSFPLPADSIISFSSKLFSDEPFIIRTEDSPTKFQLKLKKSRRCIYGTIVDEAGVGLPGVEVIANPVIRQRKYAAITNYDGEYIFANTPTGRYNLTATLRGFKSVTKKGIKLGSKSKLNVQMIMKFANITENISVTGYSPPQAAKMPSKNKLYVSFKEWDPETPYLQHLKKAEPGAAYNVYLEQKKTYGNAPSFYLDCADYFFKTGNKNTGLRIMSNLAELELESPVLLRPLGHRLMQLGYLEFSASIFERVLLIRPEEPQSYRDLALVSERMGRYKKAVDLLITVLMNKSHRSFSRFKGIEVVTLMELNNILRKAKKAGIKGIKNKIPRRLRKICKMLDVDIRIVLTWDKNMTDMDLWVIDPNGEKSYYRNKLSKIGGLMSDDYTGGYGPEVFLLKNAVKGEYKIKVKYFRSDSTKLLGPVTVQVEIFTDYGRKSEKRKSITMRLENKKQVIDIGSIER